MIIGRSATLRAGQGPSGSGRRRASAHPSRRHRERTTRSILPLPVRLTYTRRNRRPPGDKPPSAASGTSHMARSEKVADFARGACGAPARSSRVLCSPDPTGPASTTQSGGILASPHPCRSNALNARALAAPSGPLGGFAARPERCDEVSSTLAGFSPGGGGEATACRQRNWPGSHSAICGKAISRAPPNSIITKNGIAA